jgi:hypothetical protein
MYRVAFGGAAGRAESFGGYINSPKASLRLLLAMSGSLAQRDASPNKLRIKQLSEKLGYLQVPPRLAISGRREQ